MLVITPLDRFELTSKTLETITEQNQNEIFDLLAQYENDFEQLIQNPKEKS